MVTRSEEQGELGAALAKAQAAIRSAEKDRQNPHLRNSYATLESVIRATRGHLGANGLSLTCAPVAEDARAGVCWTLRHSSGQWESGVLLMPVGQARGVTPAQALGSVVTYAHRYVRMHLLGCAAGDDVDGEEVSGDQSPQRQSEKVPIPNARQPIREQSVEAGPKVDTKSPAWKAWQTRLGQKRMPYKHVAAWCEAHGRPRPSAMTLHQWRQLAQWLDNGGIEVLAKWEAPSADD
jgi:hypothetical protein